MVVKPSHGVALLGRVAGQTREDALPLLVSAWIEHLLPLVRLARQLLVLLQVGVTNALEALNGGADPHGESRAPLRRGQEHPTVHVVVVHLH